MGQFVDTQFPVDLLFHLEMDADIETPPVAIASTPDGKVEQRIQAASEGRYICRFPAQIRTWAKARQLYEFYMGVGGTRDSFRLRDPRAYFNSVAGQALGTGDGAKTQFQLVRSFGTYTHTILKPASGTVKVYLDAVEQGSGWSVNLSTGIVTFNVAPGAGVAVTADFTHDYPVRFASAVRAPHAVLERMVRLNEIVLVEVRD
jgi:uncharacterized protein (TIGR02217 family)